MPNNPVGALMVHLLPHTQDPAVAEWLFAGAAITDPVSVGAPLPGPSAAATYKGDLGRALSAARSTRDEAALTRLSRDPRLTVRRVVASNPHTPLDAQRFLLEWGHTHDDSDVVARVSAYLPAQVSLAALAAHGPLDGHNYAPVVKALRADLTAESYRQAWSIGARPLTGPVLCDVASGRVPGLDIEELLGPDQAATAPARWRLEEALADAVAVLTHVSPTMAGLLCERFSSSIGKAAAKHREKEASIDDDAAELLLASGEQELWALAAACSPSPAHIDRLIEGGDARPRDVLAREFCADRLSLNLAQQSALALVLPVPSNAALVARFFEHADPELPTPARLSLLRGGTRRATTVWLKGAGPTRPRPGEAHAVITEPVRAFCAEQHGYNAVRGQATHPAEVAQVVVSDAVAAFELPWGDEVLDAFGGELFAYVRSHPSLAAVVVGRMTAAFGSRLELWDTALGLAPTWDGPLSQLLELALMSGPEAQ